MKRNNTIYCAATIQYVSVFVRQWKERVCGELVFGRDSCLCSNSLGVTVCLGERNCSIQVCVCGGGVISHVLQRCVFMHICPNSVFLCVSTARAGMLLWSRHPGLQLR